MNRTVDNW